MQLLDRVANFALNKLVARVLTAPPGGLQFRNHTTIPATTGTTTLTAAQVCAGLIQATPTAAANYTLPTADAIIVQLTQQLGYSPQVGDAFDLTVCNLAATNTFTVTFLTATGLTLRGNMLIAGGVAVGDNAQGTIRFVRTAAGFTVYRVS